MEDRADESSLSTPARELSEIPSRIDYEVSAADTKLWLDTSSATFAITILPLFASKIDIRIAPDIFSSGCKLDQAAAIDNIDYIRKILLDKSNAMHTHTILHNNVSNGKLYRVAMLLELFDRKRLLKYKSLVDTVVRTIAIIHFSTIQSKKGVVYIYLRQ